MLPEYKGRPVTEPHFRDPGLSCSVNFDLVLGLCSQGLDEEILDHLDHCGGARLLDLAGRDGGQSMPIMLNHDQSGGDMRGLEQARQLLRVMWRDKPIISALYDQKGRSVRRDVADRAGIVLPGIGRDLICSQGRALPRYTQALA